MCIRDSYYIDGKSISIPNGLYQNVDTDKIAELLHQYQSCLLYTSQASFDYSKIKYTEAYYSQYATNFTNYTEEEMQMLYERRNDKTEPVSYTHLHRCLFAL